MCLRRNKWWLAPQDWPTVIYYRKSGNNWRPCVNWYSKWRWAERHQKEHGVKYLDLWTRRNTDVDEQAKIYLEECAAANQPYHHVQLLFEKMVVLFMESSKLGLIRRSYTRPPPQGHYIIGETIMTTLYQPVCKWTGRQVNLLLTDYQLAWGGGVPIRYQWGRQYLKCTDATRIIPPTVHYAANMREKSLMSFNAEMRT